MRERRTLICIANGKKIELPNVTKIIMAVRTVQRKHVQASIDLTEQNIAVIRELKTIRRSA